MTQATLSAPEQLPLRQQCCCSQETCSGEVVALDTAYAREIFFRCAPTTVAQPELDFRQQTRRFYDCLPRLLGETGADLSDVIWERAYFEDFARDMDAFRRIRREAYASAGVPEERFPATTYVQQPPCRRTQKLELQVYALLPRSPGSIAVRTFYDDRTDTTAKLVDIAGYEHLYIANINGVVGHGGQSGNFREQSDRMWESCVHLLNQYGIKFPKVLRTWCYMVDIDNTYAEFNLSRNTFFAREGVKRMPASTGIEAHLFPLEALCGMDLYALLNPAGAGIEIMCTPTLNEAPQYGSAFSRGMRIDTPDKTVLHISGTASVDECGATVHLDDPRGQMERMLLNIRELLAAQGATFEDIAQATTFLKRAEYLELYEPVLEEWGIRHLPNTFVETGVCRPNLLCEMEAIAILPKGE
jgi:enamine deaminase RidA (YjgF/YER057c/UK114 family)